MSVGWPTASTVPLPPRWSCWARRWAPRGRCGTRLTDALSASYRVVRYDTRGHGRSPVPAGPYAVHELADDVLGVVDALGVDRFAIVGPVAGRRRRAVADDHAAGPADRRGALLHGADFGGPSPGTSGRRRCAPPAWPRSPSRPAAAGSPTRSGPRTPTRWSATSTCSRHRPRGVRRCCAALGVRRPLRPARHHRAGAGGGRRRGPGGSPGRVRRMAAAIPGADLVVVDTPHIASVARRSSSSPRSPSTWRPTCDLRRPDVRPPAFRAAAPPDPGRVHVRVVSGGRGGRGGSPRRRTRRAGRGRG